MRAIAAMFYLLLCVIIVGMIVPDSRERIIGKAPEPFLTPEEEEREAERHGMSVSEHRQYRRAAADSHRQNQHLAASIVGAGGLIGLGIFLAHRREDSIRQELRYEARHPDATA